MHAFMLRSAPALPNPQAPPAHLADESLVVALERAGEDVKVEGAGAVGSIFPHKGCRRAGELGKQI
jgi:hypothetical protein